MLAVRLDIEDIIQHIDSASHGTKGEENESRCNQRCTAPLMRKNNTKQDKAVFYVLMWAQKP